MAQEIPEQRTAHIYLLFCTPECLKRSIFNYSGPLDYIRQ
jgi:hypothetical protein